ncbi:RNA polymerase sigma factor [Nocardioides okcheonensis]|uniref:RNA polymerase sigma factor n=1 Tax=Nocardioides okcheonensis TaxID=2894081 RepID=UPI001E3255DE|nr:sigma-70 family RNA polymerase sigma factor [Nocardioides okcheonensis]UFN43549.1 sigma-70 family RNA polymerase sigma factor [Nocardioides okcheonensis]
MNRRASREDVEALFRQHADEVHAYLHRRAGAAGADLLGEVFVIALRRVDDLPGPDLRRAWLFGTARRLLLAQARNDARRTHAEYERARTHVPEPTTSTDHAAVRAAVASLPDVDRELVRLTEWENLPVNEAAAVVGLRPGTARVRLHRARRRLAAHPALQAYVASLGAPT